MKAETGDTAEAKERPLPVREMQEARVWSLGWPWEAQSSPRVARESWGLRSSHCRAKETSSRPVSGLDLLAVQGTLKSLLQHHSSETSILRHQNASSLHPTPAPPPTAGIKYLEAFELELNCLVLS